MKIATQVSIFGLFFVVLETTVLCDNLLVPDVDKIAINQISSVENEFETKEFLPASRVRRSLKDNEVQDNNNQVLIEAVSSRQGGTNVRVVANRDLWKSKDGTSSLKAGGYYEKTLEDSKGKRDYGAHVVLDGLPQISGLSSGNVGVDVSKQRHGGTNVRVQANSFLYKSSDGKTSIEAGGSYERTFGGPPHLRGKNYEGHINFEHKFGRP